MAMIEVDSDDSDFLPEHEKVLDIMTIIDIMGLDLVGRPGTRGTEKTVHFTE